MTSASPLPTPEPPPRIAWRQSLAAGLLLGLALGCGWLVHWSPLLYTRILLVIASGALALLGVGLMLSLAEGRDWTAPWQRPLESHFAAAGLPFFSALVILALAAVASGNNLLYLIVSGLLAALVVSGLTSALNLSGMELRFRLPEEIFAGRPSTVGFTLTNAKGFWPAYSVTVAAASRQASDRRPSRAQARDARRVTAAEMHPVYFAYLPRRRSLAASSQIQYTRRGRYAAAAFLLTTRFPFGLVNKRRRFQSDHREPETIVFPTPTLVPPLPAAWMRSGAEGPRDRRGASQELHRIRPHQPGDSARHVHWKATARAGALRVREFGDQDALHLRLRLALPPELASEHAEAAISLCAGWLLRLTSPDSARPGLWLEFVGENAVPGSADAPAAGLYLPPAPAATHRRAILTYLALVDLALPLLPAPSELAPASREILITSD